MLPDLSALPPEAQQQIQAIEQQAAQALQQLQEQVTVEQIEELFKSQRLRPFVLDIETDSTIEPDQLAEKQARVEFGEALGKLLSGAIPALQTAPQLAPLLAEFTRYTVSGFKVDRSMDDAIDEFAEAMEGYQPPQEPTTEDPESARITAQAQMVKAEADARKAETEAQNAQAELQVKQQEVQLDGQKTAAEIQKIFAEIEKIKAEIGLKHGEMQLRQQEVGLREREAAIGAETPDG